MDGAYSPVSVPKQTNNQGRPEGKKNIIVIFDFDDVATFTKDQKGVSITAFALKAEKKPIGIFVDENTIDGKDTLEGEDYARGFIHDVVFNHPGSDVEFREFKNNNANNDLGVIIIPCDSSKITVDVFGTPCAPLKMTKADGSNNKEGVKQECELKSSMRTAPIGSMLKTLVPVTDNADVNTYLGLTAPASTGA